jgi:hypothetical protein
MNFVPGNVGCLGGRSEMLNRLLTGNFDPHRGVVGSL